MRIVNQADGPAEIRRGEGWVEQVVADGRSIGTSALEARRLTLEPLAIGPDHRHGDVDEFVYVIGGSGTAVVSGDRLSLELESVVWLEPDDSLRFEAGPAGLDVLIARAPGGPR